jgi:hypothetical protein
VRRIIYFSSGAFAGAQQSQSTSPVILFGQSKVMIVMRGLVTAFPSVRPGLSLSEVGVDRVIGHVDSSGVSLPVVPPSLLHDDVLLVILFRGFATQALGR